MLSALIVTMAGVVASQCAMASALTAARATDHADGPVIHIEDVASFYKLYGETGGHPTADQLQRDYLDRGSAGLDRLALLRHVTGASIAATMSRHPEMYVNAKRCMAVLPEGRRRVAAALRKLGRLYPEARFPPVTIAIGRGKPVGVADSTGVMIGLESLCAVTWMEPNLEDRFVHVVVHEYVHVQQAIASPALYDDEKPTVLEESLIEGAADTFNWPISILSIGRSVALHLAAWRAHSSLADQRSPAIYAHRAAVSHRIPCSVVWKSRAMDVPDHTWIDGRSQRLR